MFSNVKRRARREDWLETRCFLRFKHYLLFPERHKAIIENIVNSRYLKSWVSQLSLILSVLHQLGYFVAGLHLVLLKNELHRYTPFLLLHLQLTTVSPWMIKFIRILDTNGIHATTSTKKKIRKKISSQYTYVYRTGIALMAALILHEMAFIVPVFGDEASFNHMTLVSQQYFRSTSTLTVIETALFCASSTVLRFSLFFSTVCGIYMMVEGYSHFYVILDNLHNISQEFGQIKKEELLFDDYYQNVVYSRLTSYIEDHIKLFRMARQVNEELKWIILLLPTGSLQPVSTGYFVIHNISPRNNFRVVLVMVLFILYLVLLATIGQKFEDLSEDVMKTLSVMPWVDWNKKNKQALLIFMMNAKPFQFGAHNLFHVNYRMMFTVYKCTYTLISVLY